MTMKASANPMDSAHAALRCHARSKSTGLQCKAPAVRGWKVCRCHGAGGGAPRGAAHGMFKHGKRTIEATERRRALRALLSSSRDLIASLR
jgi:hypothetical protein